LGAPFAAHRFGVTPDLITTAKGLTNGVIPMGAVLVQDRIHDALMNGPEQLIELFHGYTYSGHPVACAAGLAALSIYDEEGIYDQVRQLEGHFEDAIHSLADHPKVTDVRNLGLMGGVDLQPREGAPGMRGLEIHKRCFWDEDIVVRHSMDLLQFSPFLNSRPEDITMTFEKVRKLLDSVD
jgi:beta-alanine--pyruvate transaminase